MQVVCSQGPQVIGFLFYRYFVGLYINALSFKLPCQCRVVSESNVAASAKVALGDAEACIFAARSTKTTEVNEN